MGKFKQVLLCQVIAQLVSLRPLKGVLSPAKTHHTDHHQPQLVGSLYHTIGALFIRAMLVTMGTIGDYITANSRGMHLADNTKETLLG